MTTLMKRRVAVNPRCDICNLFMSWADVRKGVSWTPYAHGFQYEVPDEEFAHRRCWKAATESTRALIRRVAWIPPAMTGKIA